MPRANIRTDRGIAGGIAGVAILSVLAGCAAPRAGGGPPRQPIRFVLAQDAEYQPLLSGSPQTAGMRAGRVVLRDQACNETHSTGPHEETLVFLAGRGQVRCEGHEPIAAEAGQVVYIPPDTVHHVCADPGVELRYVYIVAPCDHPK